MRPMRAAGLTRLDCVLEMCNARLYGFWGNRTTALKTGELQNEAKRGEDVFAALYADPARLKQFLSAMTGISMGIAKLKRWR